MPTSSARIRGTSLIEAMVALVVFTIGILGVMQMNVLASRQNNVARDQTAASKLARDLAYAFERLPFTSTVFTVSTLDPSSADFINPDNDNGRMTLKEAIAKVGERPLLGAASVSALADGSSQEHHENDGSHRYEVAWRASPLTDSSGPYAYLIAIMVRYGTATGTNQVTLWTIKHNPGSIAPGGNQEI